jgi:hypothetical protein
VELGRDHAAAALVITVLGLKGSDEGDGSQRRLATDDLGVGDQHLRCHAPLDDGTRVDGSRDKRFRP